MLRLFRPEKKHIDEVSVGTLNLENRERWLKNAIKKIPRGKKILDAGAGELQYKKLCSHLDYVSQDFGGYDGKGDKSGLQTQSWDNTRLDIVSDIAKIPVKESSFDAVMCIEVFEHIPHPSEAIKEFGRIIKKGGYLIITVPVCSLTHFAPFYFYNGYSRYFFEKYLPESGFEVEELSYNGNWFEAVAQELRRSQQMADDYCTKGQLGKKDRKAIDKVLLSFQRLSEADKGSKELMSHGIHVFARKVK